MGFRLCGVQPGGPIVRGAGFDEPVPSVVDVSVPWSIASGASQRACSDQDSSKGIAALARSRLRRGVAVAIPGARRQRGRNDCESGAPARRLTCAMVCLLATAACRVPPGGLSFSSDCARGRHPRRAWHATGDLFPDPGFVAGFTFRRTRMLAVCGLLLTLFSFSVFLLSPPVPSSVLRLSSIFFLLPCLSIYLFRFYFFAKRPTSLPSFSLSCCSRFGSSRAFQRRLRKPLSCCNVA